jgi:hypothetical protein
MRNSSQKYRLNIATVLGVLLGVMMTAPIAYAQPENDDIANAIEISALDFTETRDTTEATEEPNEPVICFGGTSVWYVFTPAETRFIQANTNGSDYFAGIEVYTGSPGSLSGVMCGDSLVEFAANAGTTYFFRVLGGGNLVFSVLDLGPLPENDDIANAIEISALDFTDTRNTRTATAASDEPGSCFGGTSVWYVFTPTETRDIRADTGDSDYFAGIDVYTGSPDSLSSFTCGQPIVEFTANAGTTYFFRVQGGGNLVFSVLDLGPPLTLDLSINPAGSRNPQTGTAIVQGTVTCNKPAGVSVQGQLRQKLGRKTIIRGDFSTSVDCDGETPWSATVRSDQGAFGGGTAEVIAFASGCAPSCDDAQAERIIKLSGKK